MRSVQCFCWFRDLQRAPLRRWVWLEFSQGFPNYLVVMLLGMTTKSAARLPGSIGFRREPQKVPRSIIVASAGRGRKARSADGPPRETTHRLLRNGWRFLRRNRRRVVLSRNGIEVGRNLALSHHREQHTEQAARLAPCLARRIPSYDEWLVRVVERIIPWRIHLARRACLWPWRK